mmetsp:Transcript_3815/g.6313  ORF Transcript_3815/g.6313 Transcript_3815/m.6313 type:complete len:145 (-) Transcript_3815:196-630(-)
MNRSEHAFSPQSLAVSEILRIKTIARRNEMHDYTGSYGVATAIDIDIEQKSDYMDSNLSTRVPSRPPKRKIQECKDRDPEDENDELLRHINDEASSRSQTKNSRMQRGRHRRQRRRKSDQWRGADSPSSTGTTTSRETEYTAAT